MRHRGQQLPFDPERKVRTAEHIIADLSYNFLERKVLERGHWLDAPRNDYGIDATMFHHSERGEVEMNDIPISYRNLYALLLSLGFQEKTSSQAVAQPRVFFHEPTDTILAFGRETDEQVTAADLLSTEVHLQAKGIVDQPLESLVSVSPVKR